MGSVPRFVFPRVVEAPAELPLHFRLPNTVLRAALDPRCVGSRRWIRFGPNAGLGGATPSVSIRQHGLIGCRAQPRQRFSAGDRTPAALQEPRPPVVSTAPRNTVFVLRRHSGGVAAYLDGTAGRAWGISRGWGVSSEPAKPMCVPRHNARTERNPPDGRARLLPSRRCASAQRKPISGPHSTRVASAAAAGFAVIQTRVWGWPRYRFPSDNTV